jgi:hypothetical protein
VSAWYAPAERAAQCAAVTPILLKLIVGEPLTPEERRAVGLEVLRAWREATGLPHA